MNSDVYIDNLSFTLGERKFSLTESAAEGRTLSRPELLRDAGFEQHRICRDDQSAYDLARTAIGEIRSELSNVGAIVYSTCLPQNGNAGDEEKFAQTRDVKHLMDFPASRLQSEFDLSGAQVYGLNQQACTGMLGSIYIAAALLNMDTSLRNVLCVTADRFPKNAMYEQSYSLISDGAAACTVSRVPTGFRLLAHHGVTNGALSAASDDETVGSFFTNSYRAIQDTLAKANMTVDELDWIVPQNTNHTAWKVLTGLLKIDYSRVFFPSMPEVGHVISGDNIINLHRLVESGQLKAGQRLLLFMAGYGLNWQSIILEKVNDND